jgi:hypothetical protein
MLDSSQNLLAEELLFEAIIKHEHSKNVLIAFAHGDVTLSSRFPIKVCLSIHLCQRKHNHQNPSLLMKSEVTEGK